MFKNQENPVEPILDEANRSAPSLMVKLRIPKFMVGHQEERGEGDLIQKSHVCKICEKSFSSGKALGGHMSSAHVQAQANKDLSSLKKLKSKMMKRNGTVFLGSRCKICGKDFPSKKSLFGHMRSHPERHWRGMDPPEEEEEMIVLSEDSSGPMIGYHGLSLSYSNGEEEEESNQVVDSGPVVDLSKSLTGWVVTGKRGRPSYEPKPQLDEETELHNAVQQLIRLLNGPGRMKVERVQEDVKPIPECKNKENRACRPTQKLISEEDALNSEEAMVRSMSMSSEYNDEESDDDEPDSKKAKLSDLITSCNEKNKNPIPSAIDIVVDRVPPSTERNVDHPCSSQGTTTERKVLDIDLNEPAESEEGAHHSKHEEAAG